MKFERIFLLPLIIAGLVAGCATESSEKLRAQAKVTQEEAARVALAKVPGGTIKEAELEREKGKLVWSFEITTPGSINITEILVDAVNGDIVATETETPAQEKKEKKKE